MTANGLSEKKNSILETMICVLLIQKKKEGAKSCFFVCGGWGIPCSLWEEWLWKEYTSDTFKDSPNAAWKAKRRDSFSGSTNRGDE